jgi:hypothetical protein
LGYEPNDLSGCAKSRVRLKPDTTDEEKETAALIVRGRQSLNLSIPQSITTLPSYQITRSRYAYAAPTMIFLIRMQGEPCEDAVGLRRLTLRVAAGPEHLPRLLVARIHDDGA